MNSSGTNAVKTTAERSNLRNLVQIGMLGAVSVVLMMFEIPLFFAPSFYKIDLSEIPVLIGTFAMGPVAGMFITHQTPSYISACIVGSDLCIRYISRTAHAF